MKNRFLERMNFFKGLFTTAEDWQAEQAYHMEKRQLHFRGLHRPGIVPGEGQNLKVEVGTGGQFRVLPGYAIDAQGRDLYLSEVEEITPPADAYNGKDSFIYLSFREEAVEESKRVNLSNESYSGYSFVRERPLVSWETVPDVNGLKVELARCKLRRGDPNIRIDTSHVNYVAARMPGAVRRVWTQEVDLDPQGQIDWVYDRLENEDQAASAFHQANVFPKPGKAVAEARVAWHIESSLDKEGSVLYRIIINNLSRAPMRVRCEIYRVSLPFLL